MKPELVEQSEVIGLIICEIRSCSVRLAGCGLVCVEWSVCVTKEGNAPLD